MTLPSKAGILLLGVLLVVSSGHTCRHQSARNLNERSSADSAGNMNSEVPANATNTVWGGPHVRLVITRTGAEVEFDCAHGEIKEALKPDEHGRFDLPGTFVREGGPTRSDESGAAEPVRYSGSIDGDKMTLKLTFTKTQDEAEEFSLTRGSEGRLWKCK